MVLLCVAGLHWRHSLVTVTVHHLEVLHLRDHLVPLPIPQIPELPPLEAQLLRPALVLLDQFEQLHGGRADLYRVLDRCLELDGHWHIYSHLSGSGGAPAGCVVATIDKVTVVCEGVAVGGDAACVGRCFVGAH